MKKVVIAVTEKTNVYNKRFVLSLISTIKKCLDNDIELFFDFTGEESVTYMSKNLICNRVLNSEKIDGIVFLNPNLEWDSKTLIDLIDHDEDVLCGVYPLADPRQEMYGIALKDNYDDQAKYVEAVKVQADACYVSKNVLKKMTDVVEYHGNKEFFFFFAPAIRDGIYMTAEDEFFTKVAESGIKLNLNPRAAFANIGEHAFTGNFLKAITQKWAEDTFTEDSIITTPPERNMISDDEEVR